MAKPEPKGVGKHIVNWSIPEIRESPITLDRMGILK